MLWKVTATFVDAYSHVEQPLDEPSFARTGLMHQNQTLIVEETDGMPKDEYGRRPPPVKWLLKGYMWKKWTTHTEFPWTIQYTKAKTVETASLIVIHSIVPYKPKKRAREQEALPLPADDGNDDDLYN